MLGNISLSHAFVFSLAKGLAILDCSIAGLTKQILRKPVYSGRLNSLGIATLCTNKHI